MAEKSGNEATNWIMPLSIETMMEIQRPTLTAMAEANAKLYESIAAANREWASFINRRLKEDLATTTTATSTDQSSFTTRFFASLFARLTQWFADTTNGIGEVFARVFRAKDALCINETCVTEAELQELLNLHSQSAAGAATVGVDSGAPSGLPAPGGEDAGTTTTTAPVESPASGDTPVAASSTPDTSEPTDAPEAPAESQSEDTTEPASTDEPEETPPDLAPDVSPPAVEAPPEAANDNGISSPEPEAEPHPAELPATGTE